MDVKIEFLSNYGPAKNKKNMEDKELKKRLKKIPDADKNGDPIYKIDNVDSSKKENKPIKKDNKG